MTRSGRAPKRHGVVKAGLGWILGAAAAGLVPASVAAAAGHGKAAKFLAAGGVVASAFMAFFFRDPERHPPDDADAVLSGADGRVMTVEADADPGFLGEPTVRISVFLSIFDVHVNRAPISGRIVSVLHEPGRFRFAFDPRASRVNERNTICIEGERVRCVVRQIVGPVARRVVHWLEPGQAVRAGDRIGLMKFGSRLDVFLPLGSVDVLVCTGMMVRAGETVIARLRTRQR